MMKKLLSLFLSAVMLLSCCFVCGLTAQAATKKDVPLRKIGDKFTIHFAVTKQRNVSTDWEHAYYAKVKPEKDCDYEFHTSGLELYDFVCYQALIVDDRDKVVSYAYAIGEDSTRINLVGHLKGGRTYYYLVQYYNDNYENHAVDLTVTVKKHKHKMINTGTACPEADYMFDAVDENGNYIDMCAIQGCTNSGVGVYYTRYTVQPARKRMTYDGKAKEPKLRFYDMRGKAFKPKFSYKCKYKNNVKIGTAAISYCVDGSWSKTTFQIVPKGTSLTAVKATKGGFNVKWKKRTKQISGYQLQFSKSKKFKTSSKINFKGKDHSTCRVMRLRSGRTYYVRIRKYKTVDGKKYYSNWSKAKSVKAK